MNGDNRQEIFLMIEKMRERYEIEEEDDEFLYTLAVHLYENGIRSYMFSVQYFGKEFNLDEIIWHMVRKIEKGIVLNEVVPYEIKRNSSQPFSSSSSIHLSGKADVIDYMTYSKRMCKKQENMDSREEG